MRSVLHLLGTGAAVSEPHRTVTMLAVRGEDSTIVVDCGGDVVQRMLAAGLVPTEIDALVLTHEHADHVGGFALFMEKIWLMGRRKPIWVFGPESAMSQAARLFSTFNTSGWQGLPELVWNPVRLDESVEVCRTADFSVISSPGIHGVESIGLRFEKSGGRGAVAYSSDTEPTESIERLATGADILVHEATGALSGHSSAEQAAHVARRACVRRLLLVHLPPRPLEEDLQRARAVFPQTERGREMGAYRW